MTLFRVTEEGARLGDPYPSPGHLAAAVRRASMRERDGIIRLWLTEGIPSAFQRLPLLYESARASLGSDLGVDPKAITLMGSGRIGYSLAPAPDFGRRFSPDSDLDFSVVSEVLLAELRATFYQWKRDVDEGRVTPQGPLQQANWSDSLSRLPGNIDEGFVDHWKIPFRYSAPGRMEDALFRLQRNFQRTDEAPNVKRLSLRVFRDWDALVRRTAINLRYALSTNPPREQV
jgi:hypothetical protein